MKKTLCILAFVALFYSGTWAQPAAGYLFSTAQGTHTPTASPTVVFKSADSIGKGGILNLDNLTFNNSSIGTKGTVKDVGYPIGFDFTYCGIAMNRFAINSTGSITLGKDLVHSIGESNNFGLDMSRKDSAYNYLIGCMISGGGKKIFALPATQYSYALTGSAPNRILTVEFKELGYVAGWEETELDTLNFQIKLYETTNKIEFVFGNFRLVRDVSQTAWISCGLKGGSFSDVNLRSGQFANPTQTTEHARIKWSASNFPVVGQTYTLTPPPPCVAPTVAPSNLVFEQSSIDLKASFTPSTDADYYLVIQTTAPTHSAAPVNGTTYDPNTILGNGTVLFWFQDTTFNIENLTPSTNYYYHIYPTKYLCSNGVAYSSTKVLTKSVKMLPAAPANLRISSVGFDSLLLSGTANTTNSKMLVLMTMEAGKDQVNNTQISGNFGAPSVNLNVGDTVKDENGKNTKAVVIYKGSNFTDLAVKNLMSNNLYHFGAFSLNETDGTCSSVFSNADTITNGIVPWIAIADAEILPSMDDGLYGWTFTGDFPGNLGSNAQRESVFNWYIGSNNKPIVNTMETSSWIKMSNDFENRLLLNYNITRYAGRFNSPYNDWGTDSLEFQYTENGTDYTTFFTINQQNRDSLETVNSYATKRIIVKGAKGKTIKLRLKWSTETNPRFNFYPFEIEEFHSCDYPLNVTVVDSTIEGTKGLVKWDAINEETLWNIRYQTVGSNTWSAPIDANSNPYLVTTFTPNSMLKVQVQAKCTQENLSPWSKSSKEFQSRYAVPFLENFNQSSLPMSWYSKQSPFLDTIKEFTEPMGRKGWELKISPMGSSIKEQSISLMLDASPQSPIQAWFLSPVVNLGSGNVHYRLEFNAFLTTSGGETEAPSSLDKSMAFSIIISLDGGKTFLKANTLKTYDSVDNSLLNIGGYAKNTRIVIDLSAYSGNIQIGFFGTSTGGQSNDRIWLDSIGIQPTCPSPNKAAFTEVEAAKATLTFESTSGAEEWIVGIRKTGDAVYTYTSTKEKSYTFTNLTPRTNYDVCLTNVCSAKDTAAWLNLKFTSLSLEACNMPTALTAKNITKSSATLAWTGSTDSYKIKFKSEAASTWVEATVSTNEYIIEALAMGTKYLYMLQAVCSQAMGDTSAWTEVATFKTADITCPVPTELKADAVKHTSAHLTWSGTASNYQAAYRIGETSAWTVVPATAKEVQFTDLTPLKTYNARVRAVCAANDTSTWTSVISFTTLAIPNCDVPTNLSSTSVSETSAKLAWEANESNEGWTLRYRSSTETVWDSIKSLTVKTASLENLKEKTAYLWSVQGNCDEGRITAWATQASFTTKGTSIETEASNGLRVYADKGQIHLLNPNEFFIDRIELYNTIGQRVQEHIIRSNENVIINTSLSAAPIIVRIYGKDKISNFKVFIK